MTSCDKRCLYHHQVDAGSNLKSRGFPSFYSTGGWCCCFSMKRADNSAHSSLADCHQQQGVPNASIRRSSWYHGTKIDQICTTPTRPRDGSLFPFPFSYLWAIGSVKMISNKNSLSAQSAKLNYAQKLIRIIIISPFKRDSKRCASQNTYQ